MSTEPPTLGGLGSMRAARRSETSPVWKLLMAASARVMDTSVMLRIEMCIRDRYFVMENIALTYISASLVGVIVAAAPRFTALVAAVVLREKLSRWFFLGFVCAMAGVAMASLAGVSELNLDPRGVLLGVGAAFVWGVYSVIVRKLGAAGYRTVPLTCRIFGYRCV